MKTKGDKDITSTETLMTIDVPGAFDQFLGGTSEVEGDYGDTPFRLVYKAAVRITRGRGYSRRLKFPVADAREVVRVLRMYAEACINSNRDQAGQRGVRTEVEAANTVLTRCDELTAELKARAAVPKTTWRAEPRGDGFVVTNGTEFLTCVGTSEPRVYGTRKRAEWFASREAARARDQQLRPTYWLTLLDGKEIRWFSTEYPGSPTYRAMVSIVDPASGERARMIDVDDVEETERVVPLSGKPLGYTLFARFMFLSPRFDKFADKYPDYAYLVQDINEGRGITRAVRRNGDDTEGLWS